MNITIDHKMTATARKLVRTRPELENVKDSDVRFTVLASDQEKKKDRKMVFGECEKVPEKYKWKMPYDFLIYIYTPNCDGFTQKQYEILLLHELMHIGVDLSGKEPGYYIVPHDIEDFWKIIQEFGWDWQVKADG